jgi:hypothetical protein
MRLAFYVVAGILALSLAGCGLMSPAEQSTALEVIEQMLRQGTITPEQYEGLRQAILSGGTGEWWHSLGEVVAGAALGYFGVQLRRGQPTQKVGLPRGKIHD